MDIKLAFERAERLESKMPAVYVNKLNGLSSPKVWHLLNNLCAQSDSYLEIGTYMGSSLLAAMYGNEHVNATAVDNFCMKPHLRNHFFQNVKRLKYTFIEQDCFTINPRKIGKYQLYFYDGEHSYDSQYKAIKHFLPAMEDEFVIIVDDWNNKPVKDGTFAAIKDCSLQVVEFHERQHPTMKDKTEWWCGVSCFKLRKP